MQHASTRSTGASFAFFLLPSAVFLGLLGLYAQQTETFEVASIKPRGQVFPGGGSLRLMPGNKRLSAEGESLRSLIMTAYFVTERQLTGGPSWIATDTFDVDARTAQPTTFEGARVMLQKLLEQRFELRLRREIKVLPVWELVVDKNGVKMPKRDPKDDEYPSFRGSPRGGLIGKNVNMSRFAYVLGFILDRCVVDKTGLSGRFDVDIHFAVDTQRIQIGGGQDPNAQPASVSQSPSIAAALRQQLGLRLLPAKDPVELLFIEHAERPSAN